MTLALELRDRFDELNTGWRKQGYHLRIGIASGYATLGIVGFEDRYDHTANGNVVNLASRLRDAANDGQVLVSHRTFVAIEDQVEADAMGELGFKGISKPVALYDVRRRL